MATAIGEERLRALGILPDTGPGGLPRLRLGGTAAAELYLQGAHLTHWQPAGAAPVLWCSPRTRFAPGEAIRGGIPICSPWFGAHPQDATAPAHGLARTRAWALVAADRAGEAIRLTLTLGAPAATAPGHAWWPAGLTLACTFTIGATLTVALTAANAGSTPLTLSEALHSYLAVTDAARVTTHGLARAPYLDKTAGFAARTEPDADLRLQGETDRIYLRPDSPVVLHDPAQRRLLRVERSGSQALVVWNPWRERAARMGDVGDAWPGFVCLEPANVAQAPAVVPPGGTHTLTARYTVEPA